MMPAAAMVYALFDVERRDALNRVPTRKPLRSERSSPRRKPSRSAGARVTS